MPQSQFLDHSQSINLLTNREAPLLLSMRDRLLRTVFETALDAMAITDDQGRYLDVNPAACELFGLKRDELLGRYIMDFAEPGFNFEQAWQEFQQQEKVRGEFRLVRADGEIRIVEYAATANFLPHRHLSVMRDITERKQAEAKVQQLTQLTDQLKQNQAELITVGIESVLPTPAAKNDSLEQIAQHIPGAIYQFRQRPDGTYHFPYSSEGMRQIYGVDPAEVEEDATKVFSLLHPDDFDRVSQSLQESAEYLTPWYCEYRVCLTDGRMLWLLGHATPQREPDGGTLWHGYIQDISHRKQAEIENLQSQKFLNSIIENIPNMVFVKDAKNLQLLRFNQAGEKLLGYPKEALLGKSDRDFFPPDEADFFIAKDREVLASGKILDIPEETIKTSDQETRILHTMKIPILDDLGNPQYLLGISEDITERKQNEAKMLEVTQLQQAILDGANYSIISTDTNGIIKTINAAAQRFLGYSAAEVVNQMTPAIFHDLAEVKERAAELSAELGQTIAPGFEVFVAKARLGMIDEHEWSYVRKDGSRFPVELSISALRNEKGEITGFLGIASDITDRKQVETQLKEMSERLSFALKSGRIGCWEWDIVRNTLIWDDRMYDLYGLKPQSDQKLIYSIWANGMHPDDREATETLIHRSVLGQVEYDTEFRVVHPDGSIHFIKAFGTVQRNADGDPEKMIGVNFNIDNVKKAEEQLRQNEQALRLIVEGTAAKTGEAFFKTCVQYLAQVLEVRYAIIAEFTNPEKSSAQTLAFWEGDDFGDNFTYNLAHTPCEKVDSNCEVCRYPEGVQLLFPQDDDLVNLCAESYSGLLITDANGNHLGLIGVMDTKPMVKDLEIQSAILKIFATRAGAEIERIQVESALRRSEMQLRQQTTELEETLQKLRNTQTQLIQAEKMSSLGQLVAGIAHEINNPVSFIYGNLQPATDYASDLIGLIRLYQEHYPSPPAAIADLIDNMELDYLVHDFPKLLVSMQTGVTRIRDIVKSLRTFSRLDEADLKEIDIHENIESTLVILQNRLHNSTGKMQIAVVKNYAKLPLVECYGGLLNQVFMNLLVNAIDAIEQQRESLKNQEKLDYLGKITITTTITPEHQVLISIEDNGCGMSPQVQAKVFNPFFTTKPIGKGTGMGLATSYQIITENHHGHLHCFSQLGKGTEFVIVLDVSRKY